MTKIERRELMKISTMSVNGGHYKECEKTVRRNNITVSGQGK